MRKKDKERLKMEMLTEQQVQAEFENFNKFLRKEILKHVFICGVKLICIFLPIVCFIVGGVLVNNFTALKYLPTVLWLLVFPYAPFAYFHSKQCLDEYDDWKAAQQLARDVYFSMLLGALLKNIEED